MGKAYLGYGNKARGVKKIYIGIDNRARTVIKGYVGIDGVATQIYPELIKVPTVSGTYTYSGYTQQLVLSNFNDDEIELSTSSSYAYVTDNTVYAGNAGTYSIKCSLKSPLARWEDGTTEDKYISWRINTLYVADPGVSDKYFYNEDTYYYFINHLNWGSNWHAVFGNFDDSAVDSQPWINIGSYRFKITFRRNGLNEYNCLFSGGSSSRNFTGTVLKSSPSIYKVNYDSHFTVGAAAHRLCTYGLQNENGDNFAVQGTVQSLNTDRIAVTGQSPTTSQYIGYDIMCVAVDNSSHSGDGYVRISVSGTSNYNSATLDVATETFWPNY